MKLEDQVFQSLTDLAEFNNRHATVHPAVLEEIVRASVARALAFVEHVGFAADHATPEPAQALAEALTGDWLVCDRCGAVWPVDALGSKLIGASGESEEDYFECGECHEAARG